MFPARGYAGSAISYEAGVQNEGGNGSTNTPCSRKSRIDGLKSSRNQRQSNEGVKDMAAKEKDAARAPGTTTIAPNVLVTTARLAALGVQGVAAVAPGPSSVNRLFRRGSGEGVRIEIIDDAVAVDLHLILDKDTNVRDVSRKVQEDVARAIEDIVGMQVTRIDVHIEDINYS